MNPESASARQDVLIEAGTPLAELCDKLTVRHGGVIGCIAYGSCLRSGQVFDGLFDVYLVVKRYRAAHASGFGAAFNWLLPPNVYYAEVPITGGLARVKYSVLSVIDIERGCSKWFESYVWGRLAQPVGLYGFADEVVATRIRSALDAAARRLVSESIALNLDEFSSRELVTAGLAKSYATELRAEKPGRVREIYEFAPAHYRALCDACLAGSDVVERVADDRWRSSLGGVARMLGRGKWLMRRTLGKMVSILRLLKAYFTFRDGIDYLAWKLARHSGQAIDVPERVRRFPLIFGWSFFLRLYRQGVFK